MATACLARRFQYSGSDEAQSSSIEARQNRLQTLAWTLAALKPSSAFAASSPTVKVSTRDRKVGLMPSSAALSRVAEPSVMADAAEKSCAMISLSAEEPLRVAKVLKQAWMEGGIKRGLIGSVLVGEDSVRIACTGPKARLESFANWIETTSMLVTGVDYVEECPAVGLTNKFPLQEAEQFDGAVAGSFSGDLSELLKTLSTELKSKKGVTQSNDEGLF